MRGQNIACALMVCAASTSCSPAWDRPANSNHQLAVGGYMAERRDMSARDDPDANDAVRWNAKACLPAAGSLPTNPGEAISDARMPLSPGDLVRLSLPGNEPPSGLFKVDSGGALSFDQLGELQVRGRTVQEAEAELAMRLVERGYYRAGHSHPTLRLLDRGMIRVHVAGAVFQPGLVTINQKSAADRDVTHDTAAGDHAPGRALTNALFSASGVRPDADISSVGVTRAGHRQTFDLTGVLTGEGATDVLLADGDRIDVSSRGCFQSALARPSPMTMPGVRAFISNLTSPAASNASSAVGREATTFPYGTRFLQALVSGNCIGGTQSTNADRWGVLMSINPITSETEVIERRIEALVRRADRDAYNPIILPGDAVACYDSTVTNLRDVGKTISEMLLGGIKPF